MAGVNGLGDDVDELGAAYWEARLARALEEMQAASTDREALLLAFSEIAAFLMEMRFPHLQTS